MRSSGGAVVSFVIASFGSVSMGWAATYPCPSDPGFCYFDTANDGCFDAGVDTGPIDSDLESGDYNHPFPVAGSIICPPSVTGLQVSAGSVPLWRTLFAGDVLLYSAELTTTAAPDVGILAGGEVLIGADSRIGLDIAATGDVVLEGDIRAKRNIDLTSLADVRVADRASIAAKDQFVTLRAESGTIDLGEKVRIRSFSLNLFGGDIQMDDLKVAAAGQLKTSGNDLTSSGHSRLKTKAGGQILLQMTGDVVFERAQLKTSADLVVTGSSFAITAPAGKPSRLGVATDGELDVDVTGAVDLQRTDLRVGISNPDSEISGADITLQNGKIRGKTGSELVLASPGTCDLTGTIIAKTTVTTSCGSVIGP